MVSSAGTTKPFHFNDLRPVPHSIPTYRADQHESQRRDMMARLSWPLISERVYASVGLLSACHPDRVPPQVEYGSSPLAGGSFRIGHFDCTSPAFLSIPLRNSGGQKRGNQAWATGMYDQSVEPLS